MIFCMTEQDAESADLTTLMKKKNKSGERRLSGVTASQTDDSFASQLSDLTSNTKVSKWYESISYDIIPLNPINFLF